MHGGSHGNQQERGAYPEEDGTGSVPVLRPDVLHELQEGNMQQEDGIGCLLYTSDAADEL